MEQHKSAQSYFAHSSASGSGGALVRSAENLGFELYCLETVTLAHVLFTCTPGQPQTYFGAFFKESRASLPLPRTQNQHKQINLLFRQMKALG